MLVVTSDTEDLFAVCDRIAVSLTPARDFSRSGRPELPRINWRLHLMSQPSGPSEETE